MSKKRGTNSLLQDLTDGVNNPTNNKNDMLPIENLIYYKNHPFALYKDERLADMIRSVKEMGIILPIIVRPISNNESLPQYEILSGHNRVNAAKEAGLSEVPAIIRTDLSDDDAKLVVTETNLVQRSFSDLSHSERAVALKYHMDAISNQGKRTDLIDEIKRLSIPDKIKEDETSDQIGRKLESREITAEKYGLSTTNVSRYVRLSYLIKPLLAHVDSGAIGFIPAVYLSFLTQDEQSELNRLLNETNYKIDIKKAELLRASSKENKLTPQMIKDILSGVTLKKKNRASLPVQSLKLKGKVLSKYFKPEDKPEEIEAELIEALEFYRAHKG